MRLRLTYGVLIVLGVLPARNRVVEGSASDGRCSLVGGLPRDGFDPVPLVASAEVILRARADSATAIPSADQIRFGPKTFVHFTVLGVIDSGTVPIPRSLQMVGTLSDKADFNTTPVPYRWVRSDGLRGACVAYTYQKGGEFLLLLSGNSAESLSPYWSALTPTNEQVRGDTDPWVKWVREARRLSRK